MVIFNGYVSLPDGIGSPFLEPGNIEAHRDADDWN